MNRISKLVANTQIDKHGESLSAESLDRMNKQFVTEIASSHNEHDYRNPPIGRGVDAHLLKSYDGTSELYATFEFFDLDDIGKPNINSQTLNKTLALNRVENGKIHVAYDRNYENSPELLDKIRELQQFADPSSDVKFELKKSLLTPDTLTIIVGYVGFKFVDFFLEKMFGGFWNTLEEILKKRNAGRETILTLIFSLPFEDHNKEVLINFTNCRAEEIKLVFEKYKSHIYEVVECNETSEVKIARIVFNCENSSLCHEYSVYQDGSPTGIRDIEKYKKLINPHLKIKPEKPTKPKKNDKRKK
jgi:hypothetical protein